MFASIQNGPPQYRSSTIFEDASPEVVRDFFWDDEFRIKNSWDDMLLQHETLEECTKTGTLVVRWVNLGCPVGQEGECFASSLLVIVEFKPWQVAYN